MHKPGNQTIPDLFNSVDAGETFSLKATVTGEPPRLVWVDPRLLYIDSAYQRELNVKFVQQILTNWNWKLVGAITISMGVGSRYAVTDGQHRAIAAMLHPEVDYIPAILEVTDEVSSVQEQAKVFVGINTARRSVDPVSLFWAAVTAKAPWAVNTLKTVEDNGFTIPDVFVTTRALRVSKEVHITNTINKAFTRTGGLSPAFLDTAIKATKIGFGVSPDALSLDAFGSLLVLCSTFPDISCKPDCALLLGQAAFDLRNGDSAHDLIARVRGMSRSSSANAKMRELVRERYNKLCSKNNRLDLYFPTRIPTKRKRS